MPELQSRVLQWAETKLCAIPITSGMLGRQIGQTRSTLHLVEERQSNIHSYTIEDACFGLFLSYFATQDRHPSSDHDLDETGTFGHVHAVVGSDYAAEQGLSTDEAWRIRTAAQEVDNPNHELIFVRGLVDARFRASDTWPNPIIDLTNDQTARIRADQGG